MEELEMNGWTCDQGNCVCSGDYPDCEHQAWLNDPDRIAEEAMDSDETDAEESDEEMVMIEDESSDEEMVMIEDESSDEEMFSDESGYYDEVGHKNLTITMTNY